MRPLTTKLLPLLFASSLVAADLKTIQPADIANLKAVTDPQISPNGKTVAYVVEIPVKAGDQKNAHI